jgi:hypothetical protein
LTLPTFLPLLAKLAVKLRSRNSWKERKGRETRREGTGSTSWEEREGIKNGRRGRE